jgi:hypothetical protein
MLPYLGETLTVRVPLPILGRHPGGYDFSLLL